MAQLFKLLITLYVIGLILKMDQLTIYSMYLVCRNYRFLDFEGKVSFLYMLWKGLITPFCGKNYIERITEGSPYGIYLYEHHPELAKMMNNKLYWNDTFSAEKIPHPTLIATKSNGKTSIKQYIQPDKNYIIKPVSGARGYGVEQISGVQAEQILETDQYDLKNFLIQEKLFDCDVNRARHFRLVTLYSGQKFVLWRLEAPNAKNIVSNHGKQGKVEVCTNLKCTDLNAVQQEAIDHISNKLAKLHQRKYSDVVSIGWDLMINCESDNIKAYCLEGNICCSVWFYGEHIPDQLIENYKGIVTEFLTAKGYW